ncbi:hypothetical protein [Streptomyces sp. NBC_00623]|uniref:hypothetical protein n=1 Tax=Streptomyces sp. NBC_00623 TaxID=2975790 RepID=UPI003870BDE7
MAAPALNAVPFTQADGSTMFDLYIKPDKFNDLFLSNRLSTAASTVLAATQRPLTAQAMGEPSRTPAWKTIPSWYLVADADHLIPPGRRAVHGPARARPHRRGRRAARCHDHQP